MSNEPTPGGQDPPLQPSVLTSEFTRMLEDLSTKVVKLDEKVTQLDKNQTTLQQTNTQLLAEFEDHRKSLQTLRKEHICLRTNDTRLRAGHAGLQDDQTNLETAHRQLRIDHRKVEQTLAELKLYLSTFQEEHQQVLDDHSLLKKEQEKLVATVINISLEQPKPQPHAGKLQEVQSDAEKETASTNGGEVTSQSHDLASDEDRDVHQELSADLHRLSSDLSQLGNDCQELHAEMAELRTLQGELVTNQNNLQLMNRPEMNHDHMIRSQKEHTDSVSEELRNVQQRHEVLASELDVLRAHVELMVTSQNKAAHDLSVLETRLRRAKRLFHARELNTSKAFHGEALIFNTVLVEDGRHYNQQTGVFRAPQSGLYFFTASVESCSEDTTAFCRIVIDCDIQCVVQGGYFGGSGCVLVPLSAGQKVWLMAYNPSGRYGRWSSNGSFSGTLVVPLLESPAGGT